MIRLYAKDARGDLYYHEAWIAGGDVIEHWGRVGERGERRVHSRADGMDPERILGEVRSSGFAPLPEEAYAHLQIELPTQGAGCEADVERRHALEDHLDQILGNCGLGHTSGSHARPGAMIVECRVVDARLAERCIQSGLLGTEFDDYESVA